MPETPIPFLKLRDAKERPATITEHRALIEENERLRGMLEWLNRRGGLGVDVHERIRAAINPTAPPNTWKIEG